KGKEYSGPAGGNGGDGGDVFVRGVRDVTLLARYRGEKKFFAHDGVDGSNQNKAGKRGDDLVIDVPVGSLVHNRATGEVFEVTKEDEQLLVLKGGRGGAGNAVFKSSVNRSPEESTPGQRGEEAQLAIELRLIADAGLVGLPNAGKTSLLNALTRADGKVGNYAFTTLDPNLGVLYGYVVADIPGLIEGASEGKGLGVKFLRHVARTKLLLHCVSLESENPLADYYVVRKELAAYEDGSLAHKPEMVILTKSDSRDSVERQHVSDDFAKAGIDTRVVSVLDDAQLKALGDSVVEKLRVL
ncbi:MAG: GTPase Obg, partial [Patescibacteria group bacterium]|nr:GTPase Obg [Patescibacteria group bacterium]